MPSENNRVLLESLVKQLDSHKPPLKIKIVNNMPAIAQPEDKTLMVKFSNGERLQLVAELALGNVTFVVTSESGAFPQFDLTMPTKNNRLLLESIEKQLDLRQPPLIVKTVNNMLAMARPEDKTLMVEFSNGERLQTVAELAPGYRATQAKTLQRGSGGAVISSTGSAGICCNRRYCLNGDEPQLAASLVEDLQQSSWKAPWTASGKLVTARLNTYSS
ncbi:hypothetical protein WJX82_008539 [Trebouxia sp. C0006]